MPGYSSTRLKVGIPSTSFILDANLVPRRNLTPILSMEESARSSPRKRKSFLTTVRSRLTRDRLLPSFLNTKPGKSASRQSSPWGYGRPLADSYETTYHDERYKVGEGYLVHEDTLPASQVHKKQTKTQPSTVELNYKPLRNDQIRLIDFGACDQQPALVHADLRDRPEYLALSYCWGSENCLHLFEINEQLMIVPSSLYLVLIELQRRRYRGLVWADAICIDQRNSKEKSIQISLMGTIYENAREVFAWLGSGPQDQRLSNRFVYNFCEALPWTDEMSVRRDDVNFRELTKSLSEVIKQRAFLPSIHDSIWNELINILRSPWFTRLWTLQEAVLSRHLTFGYGSITLDLRSVWEITQALMSSKSDSIWNAQSLARATTHSHLRRVYSMIMCRKRLPIGDLGMTRLLLDACARQVTKAQDKVYGLYSIMPYAIRAEIQVDVSVSTQRVFTRAAKAFIRHEPRGLIPLAFAAASQGLTGLPSWVFDLTMERTSSFLAVGRGYKAGIVEGITAQPQVSLEDGDDKLGLLGFPMDSVNSVRPCPSSLYFDNESTGHQHLARETADWIRTCIGVAQAIFDLSWPEACSLVSRILVCDRPSIYGNRKAEWTVSCSNYLVHVLQQLDSVPTDSFMPKGLASTYYDTIRSVCHRRCFFTTRTGDLGIGPGRLQSGDQIVILYGGEAAFAVRKRPFGPCHELLGECYVDGIMKGQAIAKKKPEVEDRLYLFD